MAQRTFVGDEQVVQILPQLSLCMKDTQPGVITHTVEVEPTTCVFQETLCLNQMSQVVQLVWYMAPNMRQILARVRFIIIKMYRVLFAGHLEPTCWCLPGRNQCYNDWQLEYTGFLMSHYYGYSSKEYTCVDAYPETLNSGSTNANGALFYFVEARCGALKCPPYIEGREITCAVCSYRGRASSTPGK